MPRQRAQNNLAKRRRSPGSPCWRPVGGGPKAAIGKTGRAGCARSVDDAAEHAVFDPRSVWLHGTGTGGHGVLRLGGTVPNRWAALAPTNAWLQYVESGPPNEFVGDPLARMLGRINRSGALAPLLPNTTRAGVLLESLGKPASSDTDDTREILDGLAMFHPDFVFRQRSDSSPEQLASSRTELLQFLRERQTPLPAEVLLVDCVTLNPGQTSQVQWLAILQQIEQGLLSRVAVKFDPAKQAFMGLTANVAALSVEVAHLQGVAEVSMVLDGEMIGTFPVEGPAEESRWCSSAMRMAGTFPLVCRGR